MKNIFIPFSFILLFGCVNNNDIETNYQSIKSLLGNDFISHMPKQASRNTLYVQSNFESVKTNNANGNKYGFTPFRFFIVEQYSKVEFEKKLENVLNIYSIVCDINDTNYVLVCSYINDSWYFKIKGCASGEESKIVFKRNYRNNNNNIAIPFFNNDDIDNIRDFKIYLIAAESGTYLREYLPNNKNLLPKNWQHGYSKGFAISEKENIIVYWVMIW